MLRIIRDLKGVVYIVVWSIGRIRRFRLMNCSLGRLKILMIFYDSII